jgi:hypothetical protein
MKTVLALPLVLLLVGCAAVGGPGVVGRWDLTMRPVEGTPYPSWFEVTLAEGGLQGRFQGAGGHATPIHRIEANGDRFRFVRPPEQRPGDPGPRFEGRVSGDQLTGTMTSLNGTVTPFTGARTPALLRTSPPVWGEPVDLLAGGIEAWRLQNPASRPSWRIVDGVLENTETGGNLVTHATWMDFRLQVEVNVPPGGNSGIYLRGRHEVQVLDSYGKEPTSREMGGIYGQLTPTSNPSLQPGEWQSFDITLLGRRVTVILNGVTIIDDQEIPGITGGALDANSGEPGPIMLQGDHGPVRYRNMVLTPAG